MTREEFSNQFDVLYNNITSNQAAGLTEYEKSVFLTKAQNEIVKNYFTAESKGNQLNQGFDDSAKRQADFSCLMKTSSCNSSSLTGSGDTVSYSYQYKDSNGYTQSKTVSFTVSQIDPRSLIFVYPLDVFIPINETLTDTAKKKYMQVIPLRFDEYTRLMSKPFKRPVKNQAWRLINSNNSSDKWVRCVEIITSPDYGSSSPLTYAIRYIRFPQPIIVGNLDGLTIGGCYLVGTSSEDNTAKAVSGECELDPIIHEDILQRAVELAKIAWTSSGNDNAQLVVEAGARSE